MMQLISSSMAHFPFLKISTLPVDGILNAVFVKYLLSTATHVLSPARIVSIVAMGHLRPASDQEYLEYLVIPLSLCKAYGDGG